MKDHSMMTSQEGSPPRVLADPLIFYAVSYFMSRLPDAIMVPMRTVAVVTAVHLLQHLRVIAPKACSPDSTPKSMTQMLHPQF